MIDSKDIIQKITIIILIFFFNIMSQKLKMIQLGCKDHDLREIKVFTRLTFLHLVVFKPTQRIL